jgi:hypothetical protein
VRKVPICCCCASFLRVIAYLFAGALPETNTKHLSRLRRSAGISATSNRNPPQCIVCNCTTSHDMQQRSEIDTSLSMHLSSPPRPLAARATPTSSPTSSNGSSNIVFIIVSNARKALVCNVWLTQAGRHRHPSTSHLYNHTGHYPSSTARSKSQTQIHSNFVPEAEVVLMVSTDQVWPGCCQRANSRPVTKSLYDRHLLQPCRQ